MHHGGGSNLFELPFLLDADVSFTGGPTDECNSDLANLFEYSISVGTFKVGLATCLLCEVFHGCCRKVVEVFELGFNLFYDERFEAKPGERIFIIG